MAGRKRKFPEGDNVDIHEACKQHGGQHEGLRGNIGSDDPTSSGHHEPHGEHGVNLRRVVLLNNDDLQNPDLSEDVIPRIQNDPDQERQVVVEEEAEPENGDIAMDASDDDSVHSGHVQDDLWPHDDPETEQEQEQQPNHGNGVNMDNDTDDQNVFHDDDQEENLNQENGLDEENVVDQESGTEDHDQISDTGKKLFTFNLSLLLILIVRLRNVHFFLSVKHTIS